jgi:Ca-activated chloride channel family protein
MFFDSAVPPPPTPEPLGAARARLQKQVDGVFADGGTSLYEAVAVAYDAMLRRAKQEHGRIHALVVMTDGRDEGSKITLEQLQHKFNPENAPVKIFTIAYGEAADPTILEAIATAGQGTSVKGSTDTIVQVYRDLSAFF